MREDAEMDGRIFSLEDVDNLFNNIELLLIISEQFLIALESRFASYSNFACYGTIMLIPSGL